MIVPAHPTIYVAKSAVDLRWGVDRLAGLVRERFGRDPRDGALFVFLDKVRNRLKVLFFDASGAWPFSAADHARCAGHASGHLG